MKKILLTILSFCTLVQSYGQENNTTGVVVASQFGVTRPLREIFAENPVDENKIYQEKESKDRQHRVAAEFPLTAEQDAAYGNDPKTLQNEMGKVPGEPTRANWAGQTASGFRPYDPSGAVGPNHYVQMINSTTFKVITKQQEL
jgi:hypothetical protein